MDLERMLEEWLKALDTAQASAEYADEGTQERIERVKFEMAVLLNWLELTAEVKRRASG